MRKSIGRWAIGVIALATFLGCQAAPKEEKSNQEPVGENAILEETFEEGDTGEFASESPEADEAEARDPDGKE